jgi:hypothetical protein
MEFRLKILDEEEGNLYDVEFQSLSDIISFREIEERITYTKTENNVFEENKNLRKMVEDLQEQLFW